MPDKKDNRGGLRNGAGRPAGAQNMRTLFAVQHYRDKYPIMPLDHMMEIINGRDPLQRVAEQHAVCKGKKGKKPLSVVVTGDLTLGLRCEMAVRSAGFLHPRLNNVELHDQRNDTAKYSMDVSKLSDAELEVFEQLMIKAGRPMAQLPAPLEGEDDVDRDHGRSYPVGHDGADDADS